MTKNEKSRLTVTIDSSVYETIEKDRGPLISRSKYVDYLLKKGILTLRKERGEA